MSLMVFALATALCALTKRPPSRFVMSDKRTPLRQIHFTGQGFAVVHHRLTTYNCTIPPFVAELRAKKTTNPVASPVPTDLTIVADDVPPAFDNELSQVVVTVWLMNPVQMESHIVGIIRTRILVMVTL